MRKNSLESNSQARMLPMDRTVKDTIKDFQSGRYDRSRDDQFSFYPFLPATVVKTCKPAHISQSILRLSMSIWRHSGSKLSRWYVGFISHWFSAVNTQWQVFGGEGGRSFPRFIGELTYSHIHRLVGFSQYMYCARYHRESRRRLARYAKNHKHLADVSWN